MANAKLKRIEGIKEKIQQLENLQKEILQEYKEDLKKERTHRICKRGGMVEKFMPESVEFTDDQMKWLLEILLTSGFAKKKIEEMKGKKDIPSKVEPAKIVTVETSDSDEDEDFAGKIEDDD